MSRLLESLLDPERRAECVQHDDEPRANVRGDYRWPQVPARNDAPQRRRIDAPRASRFGDLTQ